MYRPKLHKLIDIIFITLSATLCGYDGWEEIELFAKAKVDWLRKYIELPNGVPSHDTIRRVFMLLNPSDFRRCFKQWVDELGLPLNHEIIAIDGKTARGRAVRLKISWQYILSLLGPASTKLC